MSYNYGQFTPEHFDLMRQGLLDFNEGRFWQCHEELEDIWLESVGDNARYVYWAIIQLAACLYHWEDENLKGASGMIAKAKRKIEFCESNNVETELMEKCLDWSNLKAIVKLIPQENELEDFKDRPAQWRISIS